MGGLVFASGPDPLHTPRMPQDIYDAVKSGCTALLHAAFHVVASPIDGPAKRDYGDVDLVVAGPKCPDLWSSAVAAGDKDELVQLLAGVLGAERTARAAGGVMSAHFAVPWPEGPSQETEEQSSGEKKKHVQVDVTVCATFRDMQWALFKHAHGDIWNILGSIIRPYGLSVGENAMWLRVPEIERRNKKRARILLTSDPVQILEFLGLSLDVYWGGPFKSRWKMYEYTAQCRMFLAWGDGDPEGSGDMTKDDAAATGATAPREKLRIDEGEGGVTKPTTIASKKNLRSNDRRRLNQRPAFRAWLEEFIPHYRNAGLHTSNPATRESIRDDAFERFPGSKPEYEARRREFLSEQQRLFVKNTLLKEAVPTPALVLRDDDGKLTAQSQRDVAVASRVRKMLLGVLFEEEVEGAADVSSVAAPGDRVRNREGLLDLDETRKWVEEVKDAAGLIVAARIRASGENWLRKTVEARKRAKADERASNSDAADQASTSQ